MTPSCSFNISMQLRVSSSTRAQTQVRARRDGPERGHRSPGLLRRPADARRSFLTGKIERKLAHLESLTTLCSQDALLILRYCLQHDLLHLCRTLRTEDLGADVWNRLNLTLHDTLRSIRSTSSNGPGAAAMWMMSTSSGETAISGTAPLSDPLFGRAEHLCFR